MFSDRYRRVVIWICLIATPVFVYGAMRALQSNSNQVLDWLPRSFAETQRLFWFVRRFGSDEILVASWPGCQLDDERLERFAAELRKPYPDESGNPKPVFRQVDTGRSALAQLMGEPLNLPESVARARLEDWLIGGDGTSTCVVARIARLAGERDAGFNRKRAVSYTKEVAQRLGISDEDLLLAGPTVDSVAIDTAGQQGLILMGFLSVVSGALLGRLCLPSWRLVATVFLTAIFAAAVSLAIVHYSGHKMDAIMMTMPALIFVLTTAGGVHLANYLRESRRETDDKCAVAAALSIGRLPCILSCVTTAIGLLSLAVSRVTPVVRFGMFASIGVLVGLVCLLVLWPVLAQTIVLRGPAQEASSRSKAVRESQWWMPIYRFSTQHFGWILLASLVLYPCLFAGMLRINTSVRLRDLLPSSSSLLTSYDALQSQIGPIVPVEVVVMFPKSAADPGKAMWQRATIVESLRAEIDGMPETGAAIAATTFAPTFPVGQGGRQLMLRRVLGNQMSAQRGRFQQLGFLATDDDYELWRISTRVSTELGDYGDFLNALDAHVAEFLTHHADASGEVQAQICGAVPLIQMAQRQLLVDLINSFFLAFVLIGLTMMALLFNPMGGLLSMIPNVFPTLLVFGINGWRGSAVDIGTMMTACIALGIAVDDTLHFLVCFRRAVQRGLSRREATREAFQHVASAMLQTSIICGFGMTAFMLSPFGPIAGFAGMMVALLGAALIGDLVVLPAMLVSPLGRFFVRTSKTRRTLVEQKDVEPNLNTIS